MSRPVIAVTSWRRSLSTPLGESTDLYTLGAEYARAVDAAGGVPILVAGLDGSSVADLLDRVDGVLLSGGQDVAEGAGVDVTEQDAERDSTEFVILSEARRRSLPVFGICRGLQIINVFLGGSLVDDLPATDAHPSLPEDADQTASRHAVVPLASWVADALGEPEVNSIHHQAIESLAPGLSVAAVAGDGVIEAVDGTDPDWFLRAVQWHPEKMPGADGREHVKRILTDFIDASAARASRSGRPQSNDTHDMEKNA